MDQWNSKKFLIKNNPKMLKTLGGKPDREKIAGFIYIGEKVDLPMERTRPNFDTIVSYL